MMNKEFRFSNMILSYGENMQIYNDINIEFVNLKMYYMSEFITEYKRYGKLDKFCENGLSLGIKILSSFAEKAADICIKHEIYNMDANSFISGNPGAKNLSSWVNAFSVIHDKYLDIEYEKASAEEKRRIRKEARGRFVGFGAGISGAVSASMKAGALNMATGAAHGVYNAIGNIATSISAYSNKREIYHSKDTLRCLLMGLNKSIDDLLKYLIIDVLKINPFKDVDFQYIKSIWNNIKSGKIPANKKQELLYKILELNPYHIYAYDSLNDTFNDESDVNVLKNMKNYFHILEINTNKMFVNEASVEMSDEEMNLYKDVLGISPEAHYNLAKHLLEKNYKIGLDWLYKAVNENNLNAIIYLASCCERNFGDKKLLQAVFENAIICKNAEVMYLAGQIYEKGTVFPKNIDKALLYYTKASECNNSDATYLLAQFYEMGKYVAQDYAISFNLYSKLSLIQHPQGIYKLAMFYQNGYGVAADECKAAELYEQAYNLGVVEAAFYIGKHYENINETEKAFEWYKISADAGNGEAAYYVGDMYQKKGNYYEAEQYYKKSLANGYVLAQNKLDELNANADAVKEIKDVKKSINQDIWKARIKTVAKVLIPICALAAFSHFSEDTMDSKNEVNTNNSIQSVQTRESVVSNNAVKNSSQIPYNYYFYEKDKFDAQIGEFSQTINAHLQNNNSYVGTNYDEQGVKILNEIIEVKEKLKADKDNFNKSETALLIKLFELEEQRIGGMIEGIRYSKNGKDHMIGFRKGTAAAYEFDDVNAELKRRMGK